MRGSGNWRKRQKTLAILGLVALFGATLALQSERLQRWDRHNRDSYSALLPLREPSPDIVLVLVREPSLKRLGQWPWPRSLHGRLLGRLGPAKTVAIDILFPERTVPEEDLLFAEAVRAHGNCVLAMHLAKEGGEDLAVLPYDELSRAARSLGVTNVVADIDGLYRYTTPLWPYGERSLPSLALAAHLAHSGESLGLEKRHLELGGRALPLEPSGGLWLPLVDEEHFRTFEYVDVLDGTIAPETFSGALVGVGVEAAGLALQDLLPLPRQGEVRPVVGSAFLALAIEAMRDPHPLRSLPLVPARLLSLLFASLAAVAGLTLPPRRGLPLVVALVAALLLLPLPLLALFHLWIAPAAAATGAFFLYLIALALRFHLLQRAAEQERLLAFEGVVRAIVAAVDAKDPDTGGHSERVADLARRLGERLNLSRSDLKDLYVGALLHDVGKIGIPDAILRKPDRLTEEEYGTIRNHPSIGREILKSVGLREISFRAIAEHHERSDGSGYPVGLRGDEISQAGKILAVADAFDALSSRRVYKGGWSQEDIRALFVEERGSQFDPSVVDALLELLDEDSEPPPS